MAAELATLVGLDGLSIGAVAAAAGMSKGGVSAHYSTKEALQLATIDHAMRIVEREVLLPAASEPPGLARLRSLCHHDLDYIERKVFPGGCFCSAITAEFCSREGAVKARAAKNDRNWLELLSHTAAEAIRAGELRAELDPAQLAFELNALLVGANFTYILHGDAGAIRRARQAVNARIDRELA